MNAQSPPDWNEVNRLATPLPDSVLDRYYLDPEHPERRAEDPRRRHQVASTLPLEFDGE